MRVMQAWRNAIKEIEQKGFTFTDDEGRECKEVENLVITADELDDIKEPLNWIRTRGEWHYPTDEELEQALFTNNLEEHNRYAYGTRIFRFREQLNQLDDYVIPLLKEHPDSRRALVVLADPITDEVTRQRNFVSLLSVWLRIIDEKLCLTAVIRSNDFLIGWPANMYQAMLLQDYVAKKLGTEQGTITTISLSAHYFEDEKELREQLLSKH